jgi:hypothetical protein
MSSASSSGIAFRAGAMKPSSSLPRVFSARSSIRRPREVIISGGFTKPRSQRE